MPPAIVTQESPRTSPGLGSNPAAVPAAPTPQISSGGPGWTYTVAVRSLCQFTAQRGDLDRRFTPTATALEGQQSQGLVAARRGQDYESEIALQGQFGALRVRGRADGYDPRRRCLEEVKAIRGHPDDIAANRRQLHWAQLQTYGALFCRQRQLPELALALVYFDVASQSEVALQQLCSAQELETTLAQRCEQFLAWAEQEAQHRQRRDTALQGLVFPPGEFRAGQRRLAEAVYRATTQRRCLLAQAPTGSGKTLGTLFPVLRAMPAQGLDKIAYLTCKGTGRGAALAALHSLRVSTPGQALRVLAVVAKDQACEHPDKACHGDACPLARGFYDRLPAAREEAVAAGWLDAPAQRSIALRHAVCPYYLGQELLRWADVLVGDVHHLLDMNGQLAGLAQALDWRLAALVDEAHNLVERTRQMYSAELSLGQLQAALALVPASAKASFDALLNNAVRLIAEGAADYRVLDAAPDEWLQALQAAAADLAEHFQRQPLAVGPLLSFHFELQRYLKLSEMLCEHSLFDIQRLPGAATLALQGLATEGAASADARLCIRNVAPARFLRQRFKALHSATLFSATLSPPAYARQLLGLPEDTAWVDVPPAFPAQHLKVQVAAGLSTRYAHRAASLSRLVGILAQQFEAHPGNYLAFFSSFEYLHQAADRLGQACPHLPQWRQDRRMAASARQDFLDRFVAGGQGIGFAVLGGVFAEGVDLPGSRLIGVFIATLGLPPVSAVQDAMQERLQVLYGADQGYADRVPAMQRVVQAAGRVLRTPQDRGWLWLLDERYRQPEFMRLLPPGWGLGNAG